MVNLASTRLRAALCHARCRALQEIPAVARTSRPHASTAELDAQIVELQAARDAEIARLYERRREAEREEHRLRGQLLVSYLAGPHGPAILAALTPAVVPRDRHLFGIRDGAGPRDAKVPSTGPTGNGTRPHADGEA